MLNNKKIAVVVPAFNEENLINRTLCSIPDYVDSIIVVDDASTDSTVEIVGKTNCLNVTLVKHNINCGVGKTIVSGYKNALEQSCDVIAVMAGDAQMDPEDLENVLQPVIENRANYSKGNRFLYLGCFAQMPKLRLIGNFFFSIMSCIASGYYHIFDTQCGFTAIDSQTLQKLNMDELFPRYGFPTDILTKLNMISAKVIDVPVKAIYATENSGIKPLSFTINMICLTTRLFYKRISSKTCALFKN